MHNITERFFESRDALQNSLLRNTEYQIEKAIQNNGSATLMLSGGSTPKPLYQSLADSNLAWDRVTLGMVDERWVSPDNDSSNERFIRLNLLNRLKSKPQFLTMKTDSTSPFNAVDSVEQRYHSASSPFDLTILGMGNDGHTASLFPMAKGLDKAFSDNSQLCAAIEAKESEVTGKHTSRMTLTLNAIKQSKQILLLLTGKDKLETYQRAMSGNDIEAMPVRAVLQQKDTPVIVYWAA